MDSYSASHPNSRNEALAAPAEPVSTRCQLIQLIVNRNGRHHLAAEHDPSDIIWLEKGSKWRVMAMSEDASAYLPVYMPVTHSCVGSCYMLEEAPDSGFHEVWINEKVSFCALSRLLV
jgi:hypothetical protein